MAAVTVGSSGSRSVKLSPDASEIVDLVAGVFHVAGRAAHFTSQGKTIEETPANIREAVELFLETMTDAERLAALSQEILTTAIEVHA